jgi:CHASE3 domain sensor protein
MRLLGVIVAFTVLCMIAVATVTDHIADSFLKKQTVAPSSRVHLISGVTQALKRAEDARERYIATGNTAYLNAYKAASADVDFSMDRLVSEDLEVTNKLAHAEGLRDFVHEKMTEIGKTLAVALQGAAPAEPTETDLVRLQKLMDSLAQEETADVSGELEAAGARTAFHRDLLVAVVVINVLFLAGAALCAVQIGKIYSLVTICAWSKRVQFGDEWIPLEEFMGKRFGIRITHGISREEYEKWSVPENGGEIVLGEQDQGPKEAGAVEPKAAA